MALQGNSDVLNSDLKESQKAKPTAFGGHGVSNIKRDTETRT
jgi:hypothetical protein